MTEPASEVMTGLLRKMEQIAAAADDVVVVMEDVDAVAADDDEMDECQEVGSVHEVGSYERGEVCDCSVAQKEMSCDDLGWSA